MPPAPAVSAFDPSQHGCPKPLPDASVRLGWYFARPDVKEKTTKRAFPGTLLALLESGCDNVDCQNARSATTCGRTPQTPKNANEHWFVVEAVPEGEDEENSEPDFSLSDALEAVIAEDHWPDVWAKKSRADKAQYLRTMVGNMLRAGCFGKAHTKSHKAFHTVGKQGEVRRDVGYYISATASPDNVEALTENAPRLKGSSRLTTDVRLWRVDDRKSPDYASAKAVYINLSLSKCMEDGDNKPIAEIFSTIGSKMCNFLPVSGAAQRKRKAKDEAKAQGERAETRSNKRNRVTPQRGAVEPQQVRPQQQDSRRRRPSVLSGTPLLHPAVNPTSAAAGEYPQQPTPAQLAKGLNAMNKIAANPVYLEVAEAASTAMPTLALREDAKVVFRTAMLLKESKEQEEQAAAAAAAPATSTALVVAGTAAAVARTAVAASPAASPAVAGETATATGTE